MFEQFAADAREAVTSALSEATLRGDRRIGTEHLLLGVLHEPSSVQALGTDLETARAALDALDRSALAAVGIDIQGIERPPIPASRKRTPSPPAPAPSSHAPWPRRGRAGAGASRQSISCWPCSTVSSRILLQSSWRSSVSTAPLSGNAFGRAPETRGALSGARHSGAGLTRLRGPGSRKGLSPPRRWRSWKD